MVDIASTRMLMAHGFLRRIFEMFEQFRTPVDVVTTSEVSVSVTIDDTRRVPEIMAGAVGSGRRDARGRHGDPLRGRRRAAERSDVCRPAARGAGRRAGADAVAGGGAPEHHAGDRRSATSSRRCGACTSGSSERAGVTNLLLVGHGRMGQLVEQLADVAWLSRRWASSRICRRRTRWRRTTSARSMWPSIFPSAGAVKPNLAAHGRARLERRDRHDRLAGRRGRRAAIAEKAGIGVLAAANFSIGMHVFREVVEEAARRFAGIADVGAWIHESHHSAKKDAPSGTALLLKGAMEQAGYTRADRRVVHARRLDSRHARSRLRCADRNRDAGPRSARPRRVRARRARSREVAQGPARVVLDGGHVGDRTT